MVRISIIGLGKSGLSLVYYLKQNMDIKYGMLQGVHSKNKAKAMEAIQSLNIHYFDRLETLVYNSDVIFVTTRDNIIGTIVEDIHG